MVSLRHLVFVGAVLALSYAGTLSNMPDLSFNKIPDEFKEFVPQEVTDFYSQLTEEDKTVLKELAAKHSDFENEDQALDALKEKSPKLYEKAAALRTMVKEKIAALNPEAKTFVEELIAKVRSMKPKGDEKPNLSKLRDAANEVISKYQALSEDAKTSLKTQFPKITGVVSNEKFQQLAKGLLKTDGATVSPPAAPAA